MSGPDNNYFLILALLIGWWFTSFFLRPFKKFSFFTIMLQKVLVGDMLRSDFLLSFFPPPFFFSFHLTLLSAPSCDGGCYPSFLPHCFFSSSFRIVILQKVLLRDMTRSCNHSSFLPSLFAFLVFLSHRHAAEGASMIHDQVMQPLLLSAFALLLFVIVKSPRDHLHVLGMLRFMLKT